MGIINLLDAQVANLIAAGEVVERPASAVKELLENAIDAGADKITVEIKNGGVSLIRITDNGCGMTREDALVCIKRHATSKIRNAADLDGITTLGFRGEALAAISSVSAMRILTRTKDCDSGIAMECAAGTVTSLEEAGCPAGTTIIVEELFANVPARKKFLKRDVSETAAVSAVVEKIALSRPDLSIRFITDGNLRFATVGDGNLMNVIYTVLGRDFAKKLAKVSDLTEGVEVSGYIGTPENCRGNRNYENFFINGRYVKCKTAAAAVEQAFSSYIPSDRFPSCVLFLTINPAFVDVNVHPQKMEVKFSNEKLIFNAVYCAVRNTLMNRISRPMLGSKDSVRMTGDSYRLYSDLISVKTDTEEEARKIAEDRDRLNVRYEQITLQNADRADIPLYEPPQPADGKETVSVTDDREAALRTVTPPRLTPQDSERPGREERMPSETRAPGSFPAAFPPPESASVAYTAPFSGEGSIAADDAPRVSGHTEEGNADREKNAPILPWYRIVGVVFNTYVFVELEDRMLIIDKHAAHERIIFERMRKNLKAGKSVSQLLLVPLEFEVTTRESAAAEEYRDEFSRVGFDFTVDENGKRVGILQYPTELDSAQAKELFIELAARLADGTGDVGTGRELFYEKALYQASCKAAVKGGREDHPEVIRRIVEQVLLQPDIRYCPHGRPVAFETTKSQFEKRFERS